MSVSLFWQTLRPQFGDRLSPIVVRHIAGVPVVFSEKPGKLLAIGSLVASAREDDHLWGTGLREFQEVPKHLHVHAVRGPLTRNLLTGQGIECPEVYGDPAILMPRFYRPESAKRTKITILPDGTDRILQWMGQRADLPVVLPSDPPLLVIDRILQTEILVTSSLHGLILAETYGVPVVLLRQRRQSWEPHFPFLDYFASTGREDITLWDVTIGEAVKRIPDLPRPVPVDQDKLIAAFPKEWCHDPL